MANAMVRFENIFGKGQPSKAVCTFLCFFWGDDVSADIDGQPYPLNITTPINFALSDLKSDIVSAVQAKATALGLTANADDINIESFETGT